MGWTKRKSISFSCPSGNVVQIRRPGPSLALKGTRAARIFQKAGEEVINDPEKQLAFLENLPESELNDIYEFARIMLTDVVSEPRLYLNPGDEQLSPDDIPLADFWAIFICTSRGIPDMPVETKDGETTVAAVETFPGETIGGGEPVADGEAVQ